MTRRPKVQREIEVTDPLSAPTSRDEAITLLRLLGAKPRLIRHGEIVSEIAEQLSRVMSCHGIEHDGTLVMVGAALHDAGKVVHPEELEQPGRQHETAGERLLLERGVSPTLARCCRTHGSWDAEGVSFEEMMIALADHIWKGSRSERLELFVVDEVARRLGIERWDAFLIVDPEIETIADSGAARLAQAREA